MGTNIEPVSYWNDEPALLRSKPGAYVAISGNTGAGKSTLIKLLQEAIRGQGLPAIAIDERVLHHPLLRLMFAAPAQYSLPIQLNFLIQRHLILHRWLSLGYTVIIERSHLDDALFIQHHLECGHVTAGEHAAYQALAGTLDRKLPEPDVYVYLHSPPEVSMARLAESEAIGERPREFPDEIVKRSFVEAWYLKYNSLYEKLLQRKATGAGLSGTEFIRFETNVPPPTIAQAVLSALVSKALLPSRCAPRADV